MADSVPEIEKKMLRGCFAYVSLSLGCFLLTIVPFFFWMEHYEIAVLGKCIALGLVPTMIIGFLSARRMGIPAAAGYFASSLASAIFLYLRIIEMQVAAEAHRIPEPDYPQAFVWILPLAWAATAGVTSVFALLTSKQD